MYMNTYFLIMCLVQIASSNFESTKYTLDDMDIVNKEIKEHYIQVGYKFNIECQFRISDETLASTWSSYIFKCKDIKCTDYEKIKWSDDPYYIKHSIFNLTEADDNSIYGCGVLDAEKGIMHQSSKVHVLKLYQPDTTEITSAVTPTHVTTNGITFLPHTTADYIDSPKSDQDTPALSIIWIVVITLVVLTLVGAVITAVVLFFKLKDVQCKQHVQSLTSPTQNITTSTMSDDENNLIYDYVYENRQRLERAALEDLKRRQAEEERPPPPPPIDTIPGRRDANKNFSTENRLRLERAEQEDLERRQTEVERPPPIDTTPGRRDANKNLSTLIPASDLYLLQIDSEGYQIPEEVQMRMIQLDQNMTIKRKAK